MGMWFTHGFDAQPVQRYDMFYSFIEQDGAFNCVFGLTG